MYRSSGEVGEPVRVVGQEHLVVREVLANRGASRSPMLRVQAGVDERDPPVVDVGAQQIDRSAAVREHEVVRDALVVVEEVVLDLLGAVAEAQDELLVPEVRVVLHQVPEDRTLADLDERLGDLVRVVPQAHPHAAAEQHDLHWDPSMSTTDVSRRGVSRTAAASVPAGGWTGKRHRSGSHRWQAGSNVPRNVTGPMDLEPTSDLDVSRSNALAARLREVVPGGSHTYAKGVDQYPTSAPGVLVRGLGCHVWDADGNEFVEYGMGLRAVALGHAYPAVVDAVRGVLEHGHELHAAFGARTGVRRARSSPPSPDAEMVKFTKDGSTATSGGTQAGPRGDRAATSSPSAPTIRSSPTTTGSSPRPAMDGGIPDVEIRRRRAVRLQRPGQRRATVRGASRPISPQSSSNRRARSRRCPGSSKGFVSCAHDHGTVLVFDEMITGFRYDLPRCAAPVRRAAGPVHVRQGARQRLLAVSAAPVTGN